MQFPKKFGKYVICLLGGIATTTTIGINTLPHIFPIFTESAYGIPVAAINPSEKYGQLLKEVCSEMKINSKKVRLYYHADSSEVDSKGCLYFPHQSVIGLPQICTLNTTDDVRKYVKFSEKGMNWDSKIGKALEEVLLVSDKHAKFLIAHELVHLRDMHFMMRTLHDAGYCIGGIALMIVTAPFLQGAIFKIVLQQVVVWGLAVFAFTRSRQTLSHWLEHKADEVAASLGVEYSDGGIESIRSRLKLHRVLKRIVPAQYEHVVSEEGDLLNTWWSHPKRTERLKRVKEIRKTFNTPTTSLNETKEKDDSNENF